MAQEPAASGAGSRWDDEHEEERVGTRLRRLPGLVAALAAAVATTGLSRRPSGEPVGVVTLRGRTAELAGSGLYGHDTVFIAAGNTAVDAVVLAFGVPLVVTAWMQHRRGSPRGSRRNRLPRGTRRGYRFQPVRREVWSAVVFPTARSAPCPPRHRRSLRCAWRG
ncbi:hypothetical protein GCM10027451_51650 [Geodermatophilus aquaeductus]